MQWLLISLYSPDRQPVRVSEYYLVALRYKRNQDRTILGRYRYRDFVLTVDMDCFTAGGLRNPRRRAYFLGQAGLLAILPAASFYLHVRAEK
jgi:hypothetical protein